MPDRMWAFLVIALLLSVSAASAEIGDVITLTSSKEWVVANNVDTATMTAHVTNASSGNNVVGVPVEFSVLNPIYGSLSIYSINTDTFGLATTTFKAFNKSGLGDIRASTGAITATYNQKIDHDSPYAVTFDYNGEVLVNETTTIKATLKDKWGNPIDNRRVTENVHFAVGSPRGGAGFWNVSAYTDEITLPVNAAGTVSTLCKVDTLAGDNIVWMEHLGSIPDKYFTIVGISQGIPYSMTTEINPSAFPYPYVAADGTSVFYLKYTLYDVFGNKAGNRTVWINTSIGEMYLLRSNSMGEILATYGPKDSTSMTNITAIVVDNSSLISTQTVEFVSTAPTNIIVTAVPETIPSYDAAPGFTASIKAKVMDIKGNPVAGQTVTFSNGPVTYDGTYNITHNPTLLSTTAITDTDGFATVPFQAGGFITDRHALNYNPTATGHEVVTATWNTTSTTITVNWKNYPYLSVETEVHPSTVEVNGTVDVTIRLKGDGWALQPDPIDVMLTFDRSGSMAGTRLADAKTASKAFVNEMNQTRDRVGLYAYSDTFVLKNALTNNFPSVKTNIDGLTASGYTGTRRALQESITSMAASVNPDPDAVKAIVLTTDGEYNYYGCPLARGIGYDSTHKDTGGVYYAWTSTLTTKHTWFSGLGGVVKGASGDNLFTEQNMSIYGRNNNIRIYSVSFGSDITPGSVTWNTLETLSNATGAKHYHAATGSDLLDMYTKIAGELMTSAGVNTTMMNSFQNVQVNNVSMPGSGVFRYEYVDGVSTRIVWPNATVSTIDQTSDWNDDQRLNFTIGEIKLGETWETTYRLRVLRDGNIDVFGDTSTLSFVGGAGPSTLTLPHTFITAIPNLNNTGVNQTALDISNLHCTKSGVITDFIPLEWNIAYTGDQTVTERVSYSTDGGYMWTLFDTNYITSATMTDYSNLDVRSLPAGEYLIRVDASAPDAADDREILLAPITVGTQGRAYIKLE